MQSLTWRQVNAWRLSQHCLSARLKRQDYVTVVTQTGGIQAQVMSAAEMALGTRVEGLTPQDVQKALWQDRQLIKTWAMRAALHLITASELPLYVAARSISDPLNWLYYFCYYGIKQDVYEAFLATVPQILGSEPMTRQQLASALSTHVGSPELLSLILDKGWGTPLKPSAWRGDLCFGPNLGRNVTFVRPSAWIGEWQPIEPFAALQEIARRYLRAYGPATLEDFVMWWGMRKTPAKKLFKSLEDELVPVDVEGWQALALRTTLESMQAVELTGTVNLLPLFDAYVLGIGHHRQTEPILQKAYKSLVYRPQGWISAVVLVDGYIKGLWEYNTRGSQTTIKVRMFSPATLLTKSGIETEAEQLGTFLNTRVMVKYEETD